MNLSFCFTHSAAGKLHFLFHSTGVARRDYFIIDLLAANAADLCPGMVFPLKQTLRTGRVLPETTLFLSIFHR